MALQREVAEDILAASPAEREAAEAKVGEHDRLRVLGPLRGGGVHVHDGLGQT